MKILINVVNARNVGGGLQVVHNFLLGTQQFARPDVEWYYAVWIPNILTKSLKPKQIAIIMCFQINRIFYTLIEESKMN